MLSLYDVSPLPQVSAPIHPFRQGATAICRLYGVTCLISSKRVASRTAYVEPNAAEWGQKLRKATSKGSRELINGLQSAAGEILKCRKHMCKTRRIKQEYPLRKDLWFPVDSHVHVLAFCLLLSVKVDKKQFQMVRSITSFVLSSAASRHRSDPVFKLRNPRRHAPGTSGRLNLAHAALHIVAR